MSISEVKKTYFGSTDLTFPAGVAYITVNPIYKRDIFSISATTPTSTIRSFNGKAYSFGYNNNGQIGVGDVISRSSPVAVLGGRYFTKIENNGSFQTAIESTGFMYSWGNNTLGQLGDGSIIPKSSPVAVAGASIKYCDFEGNFASSGYTLALSTKNALYAWGENAFGQLGVGDVIPRSSPVAVLGGLNVTKFGVGKSNVSRNSYLITDSDTLYTWGDNTFGQLGLADVVPRSSPVLVTGTWSNVLSTSTSFFGINYSGVAYSWGRNLNGELGVGSVVSRSVPVAILGNLKFSKFFFCGAYSIYGLTTNNKLYSWGNNTYGQLGVGDVIPRSSPVAVLGGLSFSNIYSSRTNSSYSIYGITTSGDLYSWGDNTYGQLGVGDIISRSSPVAVLGGLKWVDLAVGGGNFTSVMGLASDGKIYAWGNNTAYQLGLGDTVSRSSPVVVLGVMSANISNYNGFGFPSQERRFKVTPNSTYKLVFSQGTSYFDGNPISIGKLDRIEISYFI